MGNKEKSEQLGIPFGTATSKLRKIVLFSVLQKHGETICYRCGTDIESVDEFSMDHKVPWFGADNELFWDLENVGYSHLVCNTGARRNHPQPALRKVGPPGTSWCTSCRRFRPVERITKGGKNGRNGLNVECKDCRRQRGSFRCET